MWGPWTAAPAAWVRPAHWGWPVRWVWPLLKVLVGRLVGCRSGFSSTTVESGADAPSSTVLVGALPGCVCRSARQRRSVWVERLATSTPRLAISAEWLAKPAARALFSPAPAEIASRSGRVRRFRQPFRGGASISPATRIWVLISPAALGRTSPVASGPRPSIPDRRGPRVGHELNGGRRRHPAST